MPNLLTQKMGPLPRWAWGLILLVVGYVLYRYASGSFGSSARAQETQLIPTGSASPLGLNPSAGSPGDTGQTTQDLLGALGTQQASLLASLSEQRQAVMDFTTAQANQAAVKREDEMAFLTQARATRIFGRSP